MKILFLDIDGVLNNRASMIRAVRDNHHPPHALGQIYTMDPACVNRLRSLVEETGVKIVLTSVWRVRAGMAEAAFSWAGWSDPPIIGVTDVTEHDRSRGITSWLAEHPEVTSYALLDDSPGPLTPDQEARLVTTLHESGLLDEHVDALRALFS